jgi:small-conductance mechanosensitive channel
MIEYGSGYSMASKFHVGMVLPHNTRRSAQLKLLITIYNAVLALKTNKATTIHVSVQPCLLVVVVVFVVVVVVVVVGVVAAIAINYLSSVLAAFGYVIFSRAALRFQEMLDS